MLSTGKRALSCCHLAPSLLPLQLFSASAMSADSATWYLVNSRGACGAVSYRAVYKDEEEEGEPGEEEQGCHMLPSQLLRHLLSFPLHAE